MAAVTGLLFLVPPQGQGMEWGSSKTPPVHRQNQAAEEHKEQSKVEHRNQQARQEEGVFSLFLSQFLQP